MENEKLIIVELPTDVQEKFIIFQKNFYFIDPLLEQLKKYNIRSGYLKANIHFNNLGEAVKIDFTERMNAIPIKKPGY